MSLRVVVRRDAGKDAEQAREYFESQRIGLGQTFIDRLNEAFRKIGEWPNAYAVVWKGVRGIRLRTFTYVVFYRVHRDRVEVISIVDGRRDPAVWKARI